MIHNREFELSLIPKKGLFSKGFEVNLVGADGERRRHVMDVNYFFTGSVEGGWRLVPGYPAPLLSGGGGGLNGSDFFGR